MMKIVATYPVRLTAISWGLSISSGYLIGKTIGAVVGKVVFHIPMTGLWEAENTGIAIGVAVGSMVSGFLTTFILQSKFKVRKVHFLISTLGWLVAMLLAILIISFVSQIFGD